MQLTDTLSHNTCSVREEKLKVCPSSLNKSSFARSNSSVGTQKRFLRPCNAVGNSCWLMIYGIKRLPATECITVTRDLRFVLEQNVGADYYGDGRPQFQTFTDTNALRQGHWRFCNRLMRVIIINRLVTLYYCFLIFAQ